MTEPVRILFVCLGNICRSPTVEGVFRAHAEKAGWGAMFEVDSAGTSDEHSGKPADHRSQEHAKERGYDISSLRARLVNTHDFERFDYILAMDSKVLTDLQQLQILSSQPKAELALFLDYVDERAGQDVPDPYYSGGAAFDHVLDLADEGSVALLRFLLKKQGVFGCSC